MQNNEDDKKQSGLSWSAPAAKQATPASVPAAAPMSHTAKYAGFIAAGIILGVLVAWGAGAWRANPGSETVTVNSNNMPGEAADTTGTVIDASGAAIAAGSDPALLILSPQKAGTSVAIKKAMVSEPTWVVVYENQNGKPGNALGAALFFPERQGGTVELLRGTVSGKSYLAVKQVDNGDRRFSLKDDPFLREGGEVQWVTFDVQ